MIVPMKKAAVVVLRSARKAALAQLRQAGVLHLDALPEGSGSQVNELTELRGRISAALSALDPSVRTDAADTPASAEDIPALMDDIRRTDEELKTALDSVRKMTADLEQLKPYGDFEPADLDILQSRGVCIRLFCGDGVLAERVKESGASVFVLRQQRKQLYFAAVFTDQVPEELSAEAEVLPEYGFAELESLLQEQEDKITQLKKKLAEYSRRRAVLEQYQAKTQQSLDFESLASGMDGEDGLCWLSGFIPEDSVTSLQKLAADQSWALMIREPEDDDPVPTLVRNGPKIRIIQPVFDFLGTFPGYREYDISVYFLTYFSIFFAMIVGDAGYGLLFLLISLAMSLKKRISGPVPDGLKLFTVLSLATVAWGTVTGNWFGSQGLAALPLLQRLTVPALATWPELFPGTQVNPQDTVIWLCFFLGLTQLTLANAMNFIRSFPRLKTWSHLGWGLLTGGLYFLVLNLVLGSDMPTFATGLTGVGFVLIVVFGEQESGADFGKNLLKGFGGLFTTFLDAISSFSNLMSYIRLFAVGMSSFYIASSFNDLASPMLSGWTFPLGVLIIAVGHGLNLIMAILSVAVHGIRLNMLEFSGQLGMEWAGTEYNPFRVRIPENNEPV